MVEVSTHPQRVATPAPEAALLSPSPPHTIVTTAHRWGGDHEALRDLLDQSKTIAELLLTNFNGNGAFEQSSEAPGLSGMAQCAATLLNAAEVRANSLVLVAATQAAIHQAAALATHLAAISQEEIAEGKRGFNVGDAFVGRCYWTLKKLTDRAIDELMRKPAA